MKKIASTLRGWFLLIEEPRVQRLLYFVFYFLCGWAGVSAFTDSPQKFFDVGGSPLVYTIGAFFVVGGLLGFVAILPGTWWLERAGLISLAFGLAARGSLIYALGVSSTGALIFASEITLLVIRFIQTSKADLAPKASPAVVR